MDRFKVPGVAVAVVSEGKVALTKGYGVAHLDRNEPVDERTLFGIASNTKLFTATALAILVDEGKLRWDDRVIDILPGFRLGDAYVTRELTVKDLLVHRSGLPLGAGDLLWWPNSTYAADEVVDRLRHLPFATSFRSAYAYDNVLYLVAGKVVEELSGQTYSDFLARRIFTARDMSESHPSYPSALTAKGLAGTYAEIEGIIHEVEPYTSDVIGPAGGIVSCAVDMAKWLLVQLNRGGGLFSPERSKELWTIVTPMPISEAAPELRPIQPTMLGYALGIAASDYRGRRVLTHTGGLPGFSSFVGLLPEDDAGIAILTNAESEAAYNAIKNVFFDHVADAEPTDWVNLLEALQTRNRHKHREESAAREAKRNPQSNPSLSLDAYAGIYEDPWYGRIEIGVCGHKLVINFLKTPALQGTLEHWQYDTFVARWDKRALRADAFVTFSLTPTGEVEGAKMASFTPEVDFSYDFADLRLKRIPENA